MEFFLISDLIPFWSERVYSVPLQFLKCFFYWDLFVAQHIWSLLLNILCVFERKYILLFLDVVFYKYQLRWQCCSMIFGDFFFCVVLSVAKRKRVKSPAVIEELSICPLSCISFYFIYFEDLLGVCTFVIGMFSWCMNFDRTVIMNSLLYHYEKSFLVLRCPLFLVLFPITAVTYVLFPLCITCFYPFILHLYESLYWKCVSYW